MSQNNTSILYVGLDVAKLSLELYLKNRSYSLTNDPQGHAKLIELLRPHPDAHVCCEATGGYEQTVAEALHKAGVPVSIIEAGRVRHFAHAQGKRAKTDPIDAAVLSDYGRALEPKASPAPAAQVQELADVLQRRRQIIQLLAIERNHTEHYRDKFRLKQAQELAKFLEKQIAQCDKALAALIAKDAGLSHKAQRLQAIPGVGPVTAATMVAEMPELGQVNHREIAALAGVAPYNNQSGNQQNVRRIGGGRKAVRTALYMAALSAVRHDQILRNLYKRLLQAGKKPIVALVACMRKLIILMNRLLKNDKFQLAQ
jgi:transposase